VWPGTEDQYNFFFPLTLIALTLGVIDANHTLLQQLSIAIFISFSAIYFTFFERAIAY